MSALADVRRTWTHLFLLSFVTRIALAVLVLPALALVLRFALSTQGRAALSDEEILFFFLSPVGALTLVVVGGATLGFGLFEQAGLQTIGLGATHGRRVTWVGALGHALSELWSILVLGGHMLVRFILMLIPLLVALGAGYFLLLGEHDINYYMSNRTPEYVRALWLAGGLVVLWAVFVVPRILGWMYALPILLVEDVGAAEALRRSRDDVRGHRWELFGWIVAWFVVGWLASAAATWLIGTLGRILVPQVDASAGVLAFAIGAVGVAAIVVNLLIAFFSAALFALLIVRLYESHRVRQVEPGELPLEGPLGEKARFDVGRKELLWGSLVALVLAGFAAHWLLNTLDMDREAVVIAHRGAAMHAPENTMASINVALDAGADFIEIDVQETADGEVVVFHDSDFMKTANDPTKLWDATMVDLDGLDVGRWFDERFAGERTPTLEQVLLAAKGRAKVNIELKYYGHDEELERKVIDIVEAAGMADDVVIMSLKYDKVAKFREMRPDWTYGLLSTVDLGDAAQHDVDFLAVNVRAANRRFVRRAHAAGRDVYVWTVNDPFAMAALLSRGVDGLITDDPETARKVMEARAEMTPGQRLLVGIGTAVGAITVPEPQVRESDA